MSSPQQPPPPTSPPSSQAAQAALAVLVAAAIAKLWPSLDLTNLRASLPAFKAAVAQEVIRYSQAAASAAVLQYRADRIQAGVTGAYTPIPADPPTVQQIAQTVDWAVQPLWNANVLAAATGQPEAAPTEAMPSAASADADAQKRLSSAADRLIAQAGTNTTVYNTRRDPKARGYARQPEPGACAFCLMLASRGAVYKHERSGGRGDSFAESDHKFKDDLNDPSTIKVHDFCHCQPAPFWGKYVPSPEVDAAEKLWVESTAGLSGNAARIAFRQAVEGRTAPQK